MSAGRVSRSLARIAGGTVLGGLALLAGLGAWAWQAFAADLPASLSVVTDHRPLRASRVFSADGHLIGAFVVEDRLLLPLAQIPEAVRQAFVAAEDPRFHQRGPVAVRGATITQRVARLLLGPEATEPPALAARLREALLAYRLERTLSKDQILGIFLNHVYLGRGAYGIAAGAHVYFGKEPRELTGDEAARLAACPRSPLPPIASRPAVAGVAAPAFVESVRRYVAERWGSDPRLRDGLRIRTTLDLRQQRAAETALRQGLERQGLERKHSRDRSGAATLLDGALVALDPQSGHVLAMVGGAAVDGAPTFGASDGPRAIGSAIAPFVYAAAIDRGMTPLTVKWDTPVRFKTSTGTWRPDAGRQPHLGPVTLQTALTLNLQTVAAQLAAELGVEALAAELRALGIRSPLPPDLSLSVGAVDLGLVEVAQALATLPAGGKRVDAVSILRISDVEGRPLEDNRRPPPRPQRVPPETAYIVTDMMRAALEGGKGHRAAPLPRPAAGITGTSPEPAQPGGQRDAWSFGFTPDLLCGVWVGGGEALPIWREFMQAALEDTPERAFPIPPDIVFARANPETGAPAPPSQWKSRLIPFKRGSLPANLSTFSARF